MRSVLLLECRRFCHPTVRIVCTVTLRADEVRWALVRVADMSDPPPADAAAGTPGQAGQGAATEPRSSIRMACLVVAVEAVGLVVLAVAEFVKLDQARPSGGIVTGAFFLMYAVGLALCARGLAHLHSWSRGPVVLAQLIELGVAWSFFGNKTYWLSVLLAVPALAVLVVMFSPSTTEALFGARFSGDGSD